MSNEIKKFPKAANLLKRIASLEEHVPVAHVGPTEFRFWGENNLNARAYATIDNPSAPRPIRAKVRWN